MCYTSIIIQAFYIFRPPMKWTREHDSFLIREILTVDPFQYKQSTVKKGQPWTQIADILNSIASPQFRVSRRSFRERFTRLEKKFNKKMTNEEKASGINLPNLAQNKQSIGKIIAKKKDASVIHKNEQQSQMQARANAEETGKRCLGTFAEKSRRTAEINKTRPS